MRKIKVFCAILTASVLLPMTAQAGTWTHTYNDDYGVCTYKNLWFYLKDNGNFAQNEWIQAEDGIWYWFDALATLPNEGGLALDGSMYNGNGEYVDMSTITFVTEDMYNQLQEGMSYDQVVAILGKEHEVHTSERQQTGDQTVDVLQVKWYSQDFKSSIRLTFNNGILIRRRATWSH